MQAMQAPDCCFSECWRFCQMPAQEDQHATAGLRHTGKLMCSFVFCKQRVVVFQIKPPCQSCDPVVLGTESNLKCSLGCTQNCDLPQCKHVQARASTVHAALTSRAGGAAGLLEPAGNGLWPCLTEFQAPLKPARRLHAQTHAKSGHLHLRPMYQNVHTTGSQNWQDSLAYGQTDQQPKEDSGA